MSLPVFSYFKRVAAAGLTGALLWSAAATAATPDPKSSPEKFVQAVANEALDVLKRDPLLRSGVNLDRVNQVVEQHILPYVDFQKTTRLAAGRYWRQANADQQQRLAQAFRGTLIRTYSGALSRVSASTTITMRPFRGDAAAKDVVVASNISQSNGQPVEVDYRLEQSNDGWKIYDLNVENIWLIENYRNQFSQEITKGGIEGLITALNQRNK